ncbi:MAG: hypothetical protein ACI9OJ_000109 [Myxococcota bacterium]|jgi:hypothetical protein
MSYQLADEPKPSALSHLVVNPLWPLFAIMFGGAWLSFPWFVFNAHAMGSPTRKKETIIAIGTLICSGAVFLTVDELAEAGLLGSIAMAFINDTIQYLMLVVQLVKLAGAYWLYTLQSRTFGIYEYYGGPSRNGILVVGAGYLLREPILTAIEGISDYLLIAAA